MKKIIGIDLGFLHSLSVNAKRAFIVGHNRFTEKKLKSSILFYAGVFSLTIFAGTEISYAEEVKLSDKQITQSVNDTLSSSSKASPLKGQRKLQRVMIGTFQSRTEVEKIAGRLRQLDFETWINHLKEGYVVNVGAFSSNSNLVHVVSRLQKAGLADKTHVIEVAVDKKLSKDIKSSQSKKKRSTVFGVKASDVQDKSTSDGYVPKKDYTKLKREVEVLKSQMQALITKSADSTEQNIEQEEQQTAKITPADQPAEEKSQTNNKLEIAEGSREEEAEESRRELDTFLRGQKVLYKRGEVALELNLAYGQDTSVNTFGFPSSTNSLSTTPKLDTRSVDSSLTLRYGLYDNLEFDLTVPYGYFEQNNDNQPFNVDSPPVSHMNVIGLGDLSGAIRYTALTESGNLPDITLSLSSQFPTGNRHNGLGTGFWNVGGGVSLVKTIDPVVMFGSIGYNAMLEKYEVNPGNSVSYSIGSGYSMNDRVSFTTSLSGAFSSRTEQNGIERPGSSVDMHSLQFSSTVQLTKRLFVEPFVGFGLTEDAQDFVVGLRLPYRFDQKFPLPFFSD
jgi:hypothetical protein